ncbi:MAG: NCS1 family nucleobase:cation symporter-1 [Gammaproteobacteria bacterium]|nr:NCS1 family nucleobase:cation symporter-1 [Gammaproteobacteria bacterium]
MSDGLEGKARSNHYSERLCNNDLAPLLKVGTDADKAKTQYWTWYNIFAFWMADVHSVGGYVFAASLFALGLTGWEVLTSLLLGILVVQLFANWLGRPGQQAGVPYAVIARLSFGVFGANVPAMIRGAIALVWYGIQTYLASGALNVVLLKVFPEWQPLTGPTFLGLSALGWISFMVIWFLQALVFWRGMEAVRRFIDWAGPAVYMVMLVLAFWIVTKAGVGNISFALSNKHLTGWHAIWQMSMAIALVASYFAGPTLNFSDFTRYCRSFGDVKKGNFWGLPVNFLLFSVVTVVVVSGTLPVFGKMITDPVATVGRIDNMAAALLGAFTFVTATIGINIVANFVSPAFDFSNIAPNRISWRAGGMIAALGSLFLTPWNLFNSPTMIHDTVDMLGAAIGPLYGILLMDYYVMKRRMIDVDALFSDKPGDSYWYTGGVNWVAVKSLIPATLLAIGTGFIGGDLKNFSIFVGGLASAGMYLLLMERSGLPHDVPADMGKS